MEKKVVIGFLFFIVVAFSFGQNYSFLEINPTVKIYKLSSTHFEILFPKGKEKEAFKVKIIAEKKYKELSSFFNWKPKGKIIITIYNNYDFPNGFATVSPYNWIGIILFPPLSNSSISNYDNWLNLVITHELAHVFHLDQGRKLAKILRKIFGKAPFIGTFPELSTPLFLIEGIAVYTESLKTGRGRLNSSDYLSYIKNNAVFDNFPPFDRICGITSLFPGPEIIYIYGSYLTDYISNKYGWNKIIQSIEKSSKEPILYSPSLSMKKITGKFPKSHYSDMINYYKKLFKNHRLSSEEITESGFWKYFLNFDGEENFYFYRVTPFEMPYIAKYSVKKKEEEKLFSIYALNSLTISRDKNILYFSAVNKYKNYYFVSDLYSYDIKRKKVRRLSRGKSLFFPTPFKDNYLLAVKKTDGKSSLIVYDPEKRKEKEELVKFTQISFPIFDKNYKKIYFVAHDGDEWDVYYYNLNDKRVKRLTFDKNTERYLKIFGKKLFFVSVGKKDKALYCFDPEEEKIREVLKPFIDLRSFSFGENSIYYLSLYKNGIEILKGELSEGKEIEFNSSKKFFSIKNDKREDSFGKINYESAKLLKFLKPTFWLPFYMKTDGRYLLGGMTLSMDPYQRNLFFGALYYNYKASKYPSSEFSLSHYFRYLPLHIYVKNIFSNNSYYGDYVDREIKVGTYFSYGDYYKNLFTSLYYSLNSITGTPHGYRLAGIEFNLNFNSSKEYPLSISREDGFLLSGGFRKNSRAIGSEYNVSELFFDLRAYLKGLFKNQVIAFKTGVYYSFGEIKLVHFVGGEDSYYAYSSISSPSVSLQRAYSSTSFVGNRIFTLNFEVRNPIAVVERGLSFYSIFLSQIYSSMFVDFSRVELTGERVDYPLSMGVELSFDLILWSSFKFTLTGGVAFSNSNVQEIKPRYYLRIGKSF